MKFVRNAGILLTIMLHSATSVVLPLTISRIQTELLTVLLIFREPEEHRTIIISRITITSQPEEHRSVLPTGLLLAASLFALSFPLLPAEFTAFTGC